jgi:hypothetical protein
VQPPGTYYGIVSPCSCCQNQRSDVKPGLAPCPRRVIQQQRDELKAAGADTSQIEHLCVSGTSDPSQLKNPVYWDDGNSIMVWVALLSDNAGAYDKDGNQLTPQLLSQAFDNTYINCHYLPCVPRETEAAYRANGAYMEGDEVEVILALPQQQAPTPDAAGNYGTAKIDGFVRKVNFLTSQSRIKLPKDLGITGT